MLIKRQRTLNHISGSFRRNLIESYVNEIKEGKGLKIETWAASLVSILLLFWELN